MRKNPAAEEFDSLPPDADEATRQTLAEQYASQLRALISRYPWMSDRGSRALRGGAFAEQTISEAMRDLYNPAQLDVYDRLHRLLQDYQAPNRCSEAASRPFTKRMERIGALAEELIVEHHTRTLGEISLSILR